jgi:hypothetical protein
VVSVVLFALAFFCPLLGAGIGIALRRRLPAHHLSRDATDVIKLATGLMATLVALILGLLISAANTYRSTIETEYKQSLASIVHLDEDLQAYGPDTRKIREYVRRVAALTFQERWPDEDFKPTGPNANAGMSRYVDAQRQILALQPADAAQRWFQSQALQMTERLSDLRWLVMSQQTATAPLLPVFILILLSTVAIFASFALYVQPNPTVITMLALTALAIAGATFLIVELNSPFHGLLQIPSQGAHLVMQMLGQGTL